MRGRSRLLFGRRKGKRLKPRQQALYDVLLPQLRLDLRAEAPGDIRSALFRRPVRQIQLEIGFGGGEHLARQALQNPDIGFIGVEPFVNGMAKALATINQFGLTETVRLYDDDATDLLDWLPDRSIERVFLLYPDPWPKRRHWKRRFVSRENLIRISRVLVAGGEFRFATDIPSYANWTLRHVHAAPDLQWTAERADDWKNAWPGWVPTRYEAKAARQNRTPAYFTFTRR